MTGPSSVEHYLSQLPEEARATLEKLRKTIKAAAPNTTETISYQMPTFKYQGRALVGFAAFKNHCSLFPIARRSWTRLGGTAVLRHRGERGDDSLYGRQAPSCCSCQEGREGADRGDR
jgi:hypothetical protein